MSRRTIEQLKTLAIIVLSCVTIFLGVYANLVDYQLPAFARVRAFFVHSLGSEAADDLPYTAENDIPAAARPIAISVCNSAGRWSAAGDFDTLDAAYEKLAGFLGEALATAMAATTLDDAARNDAIFGEGIWFGYPGTMPLGVLAQWLGTEYPDVAQAQWLFLSADDTSVTLLFGDDDTAYRCATALDSAAIRESISLYEPDGSYFAGESSAAAMAHLQPQSLIGASARARAATVAAAVSDPFNAAVASALSFNPYGDGSYTTSSGTVFYAETQCALHISPDGALLLENS
ncbi:MAG: hypothetical protein PHS97_03510, partial [Oscillospiraceae bacterium]|nr:hypothetical protein [Oscillospiraceae bacterium]